MSSAGGRSSSDRMIALRRSMSVVETQRDSRLGWELHASDEDGRALHDQAHSPERFGSGQSASCRKAFFAGDCETSSLVYLVLLACKRREPTASTPVSLRGAVLAMRLEDADFAAQNHLLRILKSCIELCVVGILLAVPPGPALPSYIPESSSENLKTVGPPLRPAPSNRFCPSRVFRRLIGLW